MLVQLLWILPASVQPNAFHCRFSATMRTRRLCPAFQSDLAIVSAGAPAASSAHFVQIEPWCSISDGAVGRPSRLKPTSVKYKRLILFSAIPITVSLCEEHRHF